MILNAASDSSALYVLACVDQHCQHWWNLRPQNWDGQMRKILYLCIISPVGLLQKKRTTFIFRHSDHTKATFTFNELLPRRHLLQIGNETKIIAGSKDISSNVCRPQSTSSGLQSTSSPPTGGYLTGSPEILYNVWVSGFLLETKLLQDVLS